MREAIERLAARYGQVLTVYQDEQAHTVRAFLQPDPSRDEQVPDGMSPIGFIWARCPCPPGTGWSGRMPPSGCAAAGPMRWGRPFYTGGRPWNRRNHSEGADTDPAGRH